MSEKASTASRVARGLRRRCPRCSAPAFRSWYQMLDTCGSCGIRFEREEGYWVGAVIVNTTVTFVSFVGLFATLTVATWPDVPWTTVMSVTIAVNLVLPVLFYPVSKSLWSALELSWHPLEPSEVEAARARTGR